MKTLAIILLLAACGKAEPTSGSKTVDKGSSAPVEVIKPTAGFESFKVTREGKPVAMTRAFIKRVSPDQWRLFVGDAEGSCEQLLSGVTNSVKGATHFVTTLRRQLAPDGTPSIKLTDLWTAGHPTKATYSTARITEPTDPGAKVEVELQKITDDDEGKIMTAEGSLIALGCGDQPPDGAGVPKDSHVSAATVTIAGKKLDVRSATLEGDDVTLSTGPKDCSPVTPWSQVVVQRHTGTWSLSGTWFPNPIQAPADTTKELKVTTGAQGSGKDGPTMAITLAGSGTIGEYPVTLDGTIEAIDCPKGK
ncbi:hypothetical protein BH11MYX3_BH11MYX3_01480 [soil metagenome]